MKKLWCYLKGFKKECILAPLFKLLEACFELFVPLVVAFIIDTAIVEKNKGAVGVSFAVLAALGLIGLVCAVMAQWFSAKAAVGFSTKLRSAVFGHINTLSYSLLDKSGTSTLITRITSDIDRLQTGINLTLRLFLRSPVIVFGAAIMAFTIDFKAALIFLLTIAVLSVIVFGIMLISMPRQKKVQENLDNLTKATRENLYGVRAVRAFCKEEGEIRDYKSINTLLNTAQKAVGRISAALNPLTYITVNCAVILLLNFGAVRVNAGPLTTGQVVALYNYMGQILVELIKLANVIVNMVKAGASANRISAVLETENNQTDGNKVLENIESIEFKNVSVCYNKGADNTLTDISFSVKKGQTVGIIGGTGSGKTSLVNLLPRFYDITSGEILINRQPITDYTINSLRQKIAVVPQKAVLFKGDLRTNLTLGGKREDTVLLDCLKTAQAFDFVKEKGGLSVAVTAGGGNFSGGQRQRLTIARALAKQGDVLVLDDSASALDFATEAALRQALKKLPNSPITFIVSQRTSSVAHADLILVLDDGVLVGLGTHKELLGTSAVYREIYDSQFSGGEEK